MYKDNFYEAKEIADELGVSKATAYRIIVKLNDELNQAGFLTVRGKCSKAYFNKRFGINEQCVVSGV